MPRYTIVARVNQPGFDVSVESVNGARQTMVGFASEADAEAWIVQDQRLNEAADPFIGGPRRRS